MYLGLGRVDGRVNGLTIRYWTQSLSISYRKPVSMIGEALHGIRKGNGETIFAKEKLFA